MVEITHSLKVWPAFWIALESGDKPFEVRRDDRGFQKGDLLLLSYFDPADPNAGQYMQSITQRITYVLRGGQFGIEPGYVVLGLAEKIVALPPPNAEGER